MSRDEIDVPRCTLCKTRDLRSDFYEFHTTYDQTLFVSVTLIPKSLKILLNCNSVVGLCTSFIKCFHNRIFSNL